MTNPDIFLSYNRVEDTAANLALANPKVIA